MKSEELKSIQTPLKEKYCEAPQAVKGYKNPS